MKKITTRLMLGFATFTLCGSVAPGQDSGTPIFHLLGKGIAGDPNAAIYWKGRYHLYYIVYNDAGSSYFHLSSTDMVHWREHPLTLTHEKMGKFSLLASGTCILNKEGIPTIIYHACDPKYCKHETGVGQNCIAFAKDDALENWEPSPFFVEPKLKAGQDGSAIAYWDPDIWLEGDMYYALFGFHPGAQRHGKKPTLMKSTDLRNWEYVGPLMSKDMPDVQSDEDLSCPNFFKIGNKRMLLCISHNKGCRYYLGEWKNEQFIPEFHARMNWNEHDFFAPESLLTPDGRRVMLVWFAAASLNERIYSLPRELSLPEDGVLRIKPLRELESLRDDGKSVSAISIKSDSNRMLDGIAGDTLELNITFQPTTAKEYGVNVFCDAKGAGFPITVKPESQKLVMGNSEAPFEVKPSEVLNLRIFLDKGMVEVFANDRQSVVSMQPHQPEDVGVGMFSKGADVEVKNIKSWKMQSIYQK